MKKKNIVFSCLAVLFLLSAFSGFFSGNITGGIGCLMISLLFGFLAYRSIKQLPLNEEKSTASSTPPLSNKRSVENSSIASSTVNSSLPNSDEEYSCEFINITLAGVTYPNDDGTDRQLLLRRLHFHDTPFDKDVEISVKECRFNDEIAFSVLANNLQIGFIPKSQISYVNENFDRIIEVSKIKVYGGGRDKDGNTISYGAAITLKLRAS
jgi:hypothetical protein|nr:MAG: HIRAN domain protein [Bacteriophage sp.]